MIDVLNLIKWCGVSPPLSLPPRYAGHVHHRARITAGFEFPTGNTNKTRESGLRSVASSSVVDADILVSGEKLVKKLKELEEDLNNQECARVGSAHWLPPTRHSMQDISTTAVANNPGPTLDHTQSMPNLEVSVFLFPLLDPCPFVEDARILQYIINK